MNKLTALLSCILLITLAGYSQDGVTFKMQYKPLKKYNQSIQQRISYEVSYAGSGDSDTLEAQATKEPMLQKMETTSESVVKTGKANKAGEFPISLQFIKSTSSMGKAPIADGTTLYGHCNEHTMPVYDSVYAPGMDKETVKVFSDMISKTLSQIKFPEKQMKPGEEFKQETPVSLPVGAAKFDMVIVTIYKLKSIKDNTGFFDILLTYTANANFQGNDMPMKGSGNGTMEMDAVNGFFRNYEINSVIEVNMKVQDKEMKMKTLSTFTTHITMENI